MINAQLAELSNDLVYAAMGFYLAALIVFSLELAATRVPAPRRVKARDAALVGAAGTPVDVVDLDEALESADLAARRRAHADRPPGPRDARGVVGLVRHHRARARLARRQARPGRRRADGGCVPAPPGRRRGPRGLG